MTENLAEMQAESRQYRQQHEALALRVASRYEDERNDHEDHKSAVLNVLRSYALSDEDVSDTTVATVARILLGYDED